MTLPYSRKAGLSDVTPLGSGLGSTTLIAINNEGVQWFRLGFSISENRNYKAYFPLVAKGERFWVHNFRCITSIDAKGEVRDKATRDPFDYRQYNSRAVGVDIAFAERSGFLGE